MKAELWKKIDELFAAAQAQPAEQRGVCDIEVEVKLPGVPPSNLQIDR